MQLFKGASSAKPSEKNKSESIGEIQGIIFIEYLKLKTHLKNNKKYHPFQTGTNYKIKSLEVISK
jgi:hypothetical protein